MALVEVERDGGLAVVTLNRPDAMNALSVALRREITAAFVELQRDPETRVVILTGAGRAFCAGFDLKEIGSGEPEAGTEGIGTTLQQALAAFEGPIIGAINGHAITGGFELALACDVLIASTSARFADTHARVGILPGWGLSQLLPRMIGTSRAKELSLTGNPIDAEQALAWGLVNRVVAPDALLPTCVALAKDMLTCVPDALRGVKRLIDEGGRMSLGDALAHETQMAIASAEAMAAESVEARRRRILERNRSRS
jgi:enoyl-CoA hydratase